MGRKRNAGLANTFVAIFGRLPWWAGVLAAAISYVLLHQLAAPAALPPIKPGQPMANGIVRLMLASVAQVAQYLVPLFCLVGAGASAWAARQRRTLLGHVADARQPAMLDGLSWHEFEQLVGEALRQRGYRVTETGGNGPDGGVDLELRRGNEVHLVQCKQWCALKVGVDVVRQLYGVIAARGAAGGLVVTSGRYTAEAVAFAQGRNIELVDGDTLKSWIAQARRSLSPAPAADTSRPQRDPEAVVPPLKPNCPRCGGAMVRRTARQGANAGKGFWGCEGYPGCRGTVGGT